MTCLQNRIGIRGRGAATTPTPALYINDLNGVSLENIDALVEDEEQTLLKLWDTITKRVMLKFALRVKAKLNECHRITDSTVVECLVCEKPELFDAALWYLHGVEIMIERTSTDEMSRFTTVDYNKAERLKAEYYSEFDDFLSDAIKSINPADSVCVTGCLKCTDPIQWKDSIP